MDPPLADIAEPESWGNRWAALGKNSFLKKTQEAHPEKWRHFYDRVSDIWEQLAGIGNEAAGDMASVLAGRGLVKAGKSILDIGCGPGSLSMALAARKCRVTAMDLSQGMIRVLEEKIRARNVSGIRPLVYDWNRLYPAPDHDLVVAAFFPEAFCPRGVSRMEKLAGQACVLVLGTGSPAFPFRRQIWETVMDAPCAASGDNHLTCAENFLKQIGRHPEVHRLVLPVLLDMEPAPAVDYFKTYFSMLGAAGPHLDKTIDTVLDPFIKKGRIHFKGQYTAAMVCWPVPHGSPGRGSRQ